VDFATLPDLRQVAYISNVERSFAALRVEHRHRVLSLIDGLHDTFGLKRAAAFKWRGQTGSERHERSGNQYAGNNATSFIFHTILDWNGQWKTDDVVRIGAAGRTLAQPQIFLTMRKVERESSAKPQNMFRSVRAVCFPGQTSSIFGVRICAAKMLGLSRKIPQVSCPYFVGLRTVTGVATPHTCSSHLTR
jgi:hypothetical protein